MGKDNKCFFVTSFDLLTGWLVGNMFLLCGAVSMSANCNEDTFVVSPASDTLEASRSVTSKVESVACVQFTAHSCETFDASFVFDGLLEEKRCYLRVSGQGTFDGRYEAVVNV